MVPFFPRRPFRSGGTVPLPLRRPTPAISATHDILLVEGEDPMDQLLSKKDAARRLGVCVGSLELYIRKGWLPSVKLGGVVRVPLSAIQKVIKLGCGPQEKRPPHQVRGRRGRFVSPNLGPWYEQKAAEKKKERGLPDLVNIARLLDRYLLTNETEGLPDANTISKMLQRFAAEEESLAETIKKLDDIDVDERSLDGAIKRL